jgi:hypothetical protein
VSGLGGSRHCISRLGGGMTSSAVAQMVDDQANEGLCILGGESGGESGRGRGIQRGAGM